jgi:hypothetical protein
MSTMSPRARHTLKARRSSPGTQRVGASFGRYTDPAGRERELVPRSGAGGSMLVIDRLVGTLADDRLVAHLWPDEPPENAGIVGSLYLADVHGRRCRRLTPEDLETAPFVTGEAHAASAPERLMRASGRKLIDERGCVYRLQPAQSGMSIPELRWYRHPPCGEHGCANVVTVRQAIGSLESYEPVRTITAEALTMYRLDPGVSVSALDPELDRVYASHVVLNRGLRNAVLAALEEGGLTMSEIAIRCGRFKRDATSADRGETSWLGRRIGILRESGKSASTPWVCSDVLALIAREGLGLSPREVELG